MFPKLNPSRLTVLAALGFSVAVLGGCAETGFGTDAALPNSVARMDLSRSPYEIPTARATPNFTPVEKVADSHRIEGRHAIHLATETR